MPNLYILPSAPDQFPASYFEGKGISFRPYDGGISYAPFWNEFYERCAKRGISVHSYLDWRREAAGPDDMLLVLNHPAETFLQKFYFFVRRLAGGASSNESARRKFFFNQHRVFKKRILMQLEPPVATPYVFSHLDAIARSGWYHQMYATTRVPHPQWEYFNYFEHRTHDVKSPYFGAPKTKYITMVNSNIRPHSFKAELYGERLKAVKFFGRSTDFDLYGFYWDMPVRHPFYMHYRKYVKRTWRGKIPDKFKTLSEYKFALVFENGAYPGWISEKIFDAMAVGVIPVYLGAPDIEKLVPGDCFIDFGKFGSYEALDKYLRGMPEEELQRYRDNIAKFLKVPPDPNKVEQFLDKVIG